MTGLPGDIAVGGNFVFFLIIVVIFIGLGRAYRLGYWGFWSYQMGWGGQGTKGWHYFYGGSWPLKTPWKDFNLAFVGGLDWMKWLKTGALYIYIVYISCSYSCTVSFQVKIFLVELKYLYIQYVWISVIKKQNSNQNGKVYKIVVLVKIVKL